MPDLAADRTVLVVAHGNSLRALVKHLDSISDDEIAELNIPTGIPLVYELGADSGPRCRAAATSTRRPRWPPPRRWQIRAADRLRRGYVQIPGRMPVKSRMTRPRLTV